MSTTRLAYCIYMACVVPPYSLRECLNRRCSAEEKSGQIILLHQITFKRCLPSFYYLPQVVITIILYLKPFTINCSSQSKQQPRRYLLPHWTDVTIETYAFSSQKPKIKSLLCSSWIQIQYLLVPSALPWVNRGW